MFDAEWHTIGGAMFFFWIFIAVFFVWFIMFMMKQMDTKQNRSGESALEILKRRYANGEIDDEEFEKKRKNLDR